MNSSLGGITQFVVDPNTGKITGYKTEVGADSVFPFSSKIYLIEDIYCVPIDDLWREATKTRTLELTEEFSKLTIEKAWAGVNAQGTKNSYCKIQLYDIDGNLLDTITTATITLTNTFGKEYFYDLSYDLTKYSSPVTKIIFTAYSANCSGTAYNSGMSGIKLTT